MPAVHCAGNCVKEHGRLEVVEISDAPDAYQVHVVAEVTAGCFEE